MPAKKKKKIFLQLQSKYCKIIKGAQFKNKNVPAGNRQRVLIGRRNYSENAVRTKGVE